MLKSNIGAIELAIPSKGSWPIRSPSQLSSMRRMTEGLVGPGVIYKVLTSIRGSLRKGLPCSVSATSQRNAPVLGSSQAVRLIPVPQAPGRVRAATDPVEVLTIGPLWWPHHPSQWWCMMTSPAVFHDGEECSPSWFRQAVHFARVRKGVE